MSEPQSLLPPARVLVTKIGLDGHDRGSLLVAAYLRDAGMDVIYTPPWQPIDDVIATAREQAVDVVGVSSLATDHLIVPDLVRRARAGGLAHVGFVVGGIVPDDERPPLLSAGVDRVFGPGSSRDDIVACVAALARRARQQRTQRQREASV